MPLHLKHLVLSLTTFGRLRLVVSVVAMLVSTIGASSEERQCPYELRRIVHETSVIENAADGSVVESLQNQLPDLSDFELIPERRELPFLVNSDGEIRVSKSSDLNFEGRRLWILTLKAKARRESDPYMEDFLQSLAEASGDPGLVAEQLRHRDVIVSVRIHVADQEESPQLVDEQIEVPSDIDPQNIASIRPVEQDETDQLTYLVKCATSDQLRVDPVTGVVSIADPARFDWQRGPQSLEVEVRDQHGNTSSSVIELTITEPAISKPERAAIIAAAESPIESFAAGGSLDDGSSIASTHLRTTQVSGPDANSTPEDPTRNAVTGKSSTRNLHHVPGVFIAKNARNAIAEEVNQVGAKISTSKGAAESLANRLGSQSHTTRTQPDETNVAASSPGAFPAQDSTKAESSSSNRSLDEAARTIGAASASAIALNTVDHSDFAATKSSNQNGTNRHNFNNKTPGKGDQSQPAARNQKRQQIAIVLVAFVSISVVVYVMYRRARSTRLEVMQRVISDSEARLDHYMNNSASSESESDGSDSEVPKNDRGEDKSIVAQDDSDFDPTAPFDPESLIDGILLTAAPEASSDGSLSQSEPDNVEIPDSLQTASSPVDVSASTQSPLLLLNDEFLIDDILAPVPKSKEDALLASLQAQLSSINSRFEQRNPDDPASDAPSSPPAEVTSASVEKTDEFSGDQTLSEEMDSVVETLGDRFEPAYELQWDAEIQRYVKVEKRAELESSDDRSVFSDRPSDYPSHDAVRSDLIMSTGTAVCVEDDQESINDNQPTERVLNLRAELADLFNLHAATTESRLQKAEAESDERAEATEEHAEGKSPEESHLDSVAKYLSELLERSRKDDGADIFVERRGNAAGKWDGIDRRQKPKAAKSYIESYLEQHGGTLQEDLEELAQRAQSTSSQSDETPRAPREHKPVDVNHLRKNMESFRAVAVRSVETAMATYQVRLAKARLVGRSMLITGLIVIVGLGVGTNVVRNFHLEPLNWLICAFILLCIAEFFLRVESIRKNRREMRLKILSAQKPTSKAMGLKVEEPQAPPQPNESQASESQLNESQANATQGLA